MAKKPTPAEAVPHEATRQLRVFGPRNGRRRAGFAFGPEPTVITNTEITADQYSLLISDPELVVTEEEYVAAPAPEPGASPEGGT